MPEFRRGRGLRLVVALLVAVLLGATALVAPAPATASVAASVAAHRRTPREAAISSAVQALLNLERAAHGLAPLRMRSALRQAARAHDQAMAAADELSHQLPGEPDIGTRLLQAGYRWSYAGENVAWNSVMSRAGVLRLERVMYLEKPPENGHRLNILSPNYRDVGIDVYFDRAHHKVWLTTDFGRPLPSVPTAR